MRTALAPPLAIDPVLGVEFQEAPFSHEFTSAGTSAFGVATPFSAAAATGQANHGWVRVSTSASRQNIFTWRDIQDLRWRAAGAERRRRMRTTMVAGLALTLSLSLVPQARAQGWTEGELMVSHQDPSPVSSSFTVEPFAYEFTGGEQYHFAIASPLSLASISARIDYGWARIVAAASGAVEGAPANQLRIGSAGYEVRAGFLDTITLDAPGLTGQTGTVRIGMDVEGVVSAGADWWPGQSLAISQGGATIRFFGPDLTAEREAEVRNPAEPPDFFPAESFEGFLGGTAQIVFGTPFPIEFFVRLSGNADALSNLVTGGAPGAQAAASMVGDFGSSFGWAGISELRDANGNPVVDFDVTSLSGTNYRNPIVPVPEPGTALLVLAGLAALAHRRRR